MLRRLLVIFIAAFLLNWAWERLHSVLYVSYQGAEITSLILLRAALFDAALITLFAIPFLFADRYKRRSWLSVLALLVFAIGLEWWALSTDRWMYSEAMPLIPYLAVGLTPTIQLCLLGYLSYSVSSFLERRAGRG